MRPIRVLVVDDAVVVRRLVSDTVAADPAIEVVGAAANGQIALAKIGQLAPDVVILDIEMPVMDGLQTLAELRKTHPRLPVVMFSTLTERGASATLDALSLGASDYVTKPSNTGSVTVALKRISDELIPKIKALAPGLGTVRPDARRAVAAPPVSRPVPGRPAIAPPAAAGTVRSAPGRVDVVAIGVSTGGPNALAEVLPALPADLRVPVVVVQHMPPLFTKLLAERLDGKSAIDVHEGASGDVLRPGGAWIAPGGMHMLVERRGTSVRLRLTEDPPENSCRPAVDPLFRTVAAAYGGNCLAVVLTGMGQDGLVGSQDVVAAGGQVIAQDEETSVVWGMPGYVAGSGLADAVVPLGAVAGEIVRRVSARPLSPPTTSSSPAASPRLPGALTR